MRAVRIPGYTRELAKGQPEYLNLCIRDDVVLIEGPQGVPIPVNGMTSLWEPTPQQLAILNAGGKIALQILGKMHPPVSLWAEPST